MILKTKRWINETSKKCPRLRQLLVNLAIRFGVNPVSFSVQREILQEKYVGNERLLSGKKRFLVGVKPSVSRYLALIENAKKKYKS